jgi:hypothetical protein
MPPIKVGKIKPDQAKCYGTEPFAGTTQLGITIANISATSTILSNILTAIKRLGAVFCIAS